MAREMKDSGIEWIGEIPADWIVVRIKYIRNNEVDSFLEQALFLHRNGVDALIVQDFGMICLLRKMYPNLEIHASTQANVCSKEVCKLYYDLGVKRVVFARELSIDEIDKIDVPIE